MRVQALNQILCYYVVLCYYREIVYAAAATAAAMVQQQNQFPNRLMQNINERPRNNAAAPIVTLHPYPMTRFHFVMMSFSSFMLSPVMLSSDALALETTSDGKISIGEPESEFILRTKLGLKCIGGDHKDVRGTPSFKTLNYIPMKNNEPLYYPTFMFGEWNVTATLKRFTQIKNSIVDSTDITAAATITQNFQRQYFTTIANTIKNQITINLGTGIPEVKVISNRAYNLPSELLLIQNITTSLPISSDFINLTWDYRSNTVPTRVLWDDGTNPQIRYEYETIDDESELLGFNDKVFAAAERNRIRVFDKSALRTTIETEITTEYHEIFVGHVLALSRIIIRDSRSPKSMTVLDFELSMNRIVQSFTNSNDSRVTYRPCVETPKGIVQCY